MGAQNNRVFYWALSFSHSVMAILGMSGFECEALEGSSNSIVKYTPQDTTSLSIIRSLFVLNLKLFDLETLSA